MQIGKPAIIEKKASTIQPITLKEV